tara:strand:+ start:205 stop:390 length:186 start_codon:yes stop_codon:yes gene_type:complete
MKQEFIKNIDWALLRQQKLWLLNQDSQMADGLVNFIDSLQDLAVINNIDELTVFGFDVSEA